MPMVNMSGENKLIIVVGCFFLATAGALAAFGFHGPEEILTPAKRTSWAWAVDMQFYHGGGLVLTGILGHLLGTSWFIRAAAVLMTAGMLVFSCLFYINTFGLLTALSPAIPSGGSMLMLSWIALAVALLKAG